MANKAWVRFNTTGNSTTLHLNGIKTTNISNNDICFVTKNGYSYEYIYGSTISSTENSPTIIKPSNNAGNGRWVLQTASLYFGSDAVGDTFYRDSTGIKRLPKGKARQCLSMNNTTTLPQWGYSDEIRSSSSGSRVVISKTGLTETMGTTTVRSMSSNGIQQIPKQIAFAGTLTSTESNVIGKNNTVSLNNHAFTEEFDNSGNFDAATGKFIVPKYGSGVYFLSGIFSLKNISTSLHSTLELSIYGAGAHVIREVFNAKKLSQASSSGLFEASLTSIAKLTSGSTYNLRLYLAGTSSGADIRGGGRTRFSGALLF